MLTYVRTDGICNVPPSSHVPHTYESGIPLAPALSPSTLPRLLSFPTYGTQIRNAQSYLPSVRGPCSVTLGVVLHQIEAYFLPHSPYKWVCFRTFPYVLGIGAYALRAYVLRSYRHRASTERGSLPLARRLVP
jgi:hypothetical protein